MIEKKKFHSTAARQEKAVLVSVPPKSQAEAQTTEYLDELAFLAETAGAQTVKRFTQRLDQPDIRTYVGKGKLEEIKAWVLANDVDMVIVDDDLKPSQQRNLEEELRVKILDRTLLILDIFALRAKSATARAQVELAQYQYFLPRLTGLWSHLDKQRGGVGTKGPGETEIETDRRIVRDKISLLKEKLEDFEKQAVTQRKTRHGIVRVALVGYTNVGKSTLMNLLAKGADVFAENKLFATVDATTRKVVLDGIPFLLSDTVGFIRKLPTRLVESFKSTLDEIREADLLLHVVDLSHLSFEEHIRVVNETLQEIGAADKPGLLIFNKIDQYAADTIDAGRERPSLDELRETYLARLHAPAVFVSAMTGENIAELRTALARRVRTVHEQQYPNRPQDNWAGESEVNDEVNA